VTLGHSIVSWVELFRVAGFGFVCRVVECGVGVTFLPRSLNVVVVVVVVEWHYCRLNCSTLRSAGRDVVDLDGLD